MRRTEGETWNEQQLHIFEAYHGQKDPNVAWLNEQGCIVTNIVEEAEEWFFFLPGERQVKHPRSLGMKGCVLSSYFLAL